MLFELNQELKAAQSTVNAAAKLQKKLAAVGVSAKEIAEARRLIGAVQKERRQLGRQVSEFHQAVHAKEALLQEGEHLITNLRRIGRFILRHDGVAVPQTLHDQLGIGEHLSHSAPAIATAAANTAAALTDKRWAALFKKRGASAVAIKRIGELATQLAPLSPSGPPGDGELPPLLAQLLDRVSYLRGAAALVIGPHSAEFLPFRAPKHTAKKSGAPVPPSARN